jgi:hypothetical protein
MTKAAPGGHSRRAAPGDSEAPLIPLPRGARDNKRRLHHSGAAHFSWDRGCTHLVAVNLIARPAV